MHTTTYCGTPQNMANLTFRISICITIPSRQLVGTTCIPKLHYPRTCTSSIVCSHYQSQRTYLSSMHTALVDFFSLLTSPNLLQLYLTTELQQGTRSFTKIPHWWSTLPLRTAALYRHHQSLWSRFMKWLQRLLTAHSRNEDNVRILAIFTTQL
jgi:hypothetical protein